MSATTTFNVVVTGNIAKVEATDLILTSGSIGTYIAAFTKDSTWDDLMPEAVFLAAPEAWPTNPTTRDLIRRSVVLADGVATVDAAVLSEPGYRLWVGLQGLDTAGAVIKNSTLALVGKIQQGADPDGPGDGDIPKTRYQSLLELILSAGAGFEVNLEDYALKKDLLNYYLRSETYSREEILALVDTIPKFSIQVVSELPTADISTTTIYLVKSGEDTSDLYQEYIHVNGAWEYLGSQTVSVDLTDYIQTSDLESFAEAAGIVEYLPTTILDGNLWISTTGEVKESSLTTRIYNTTDLISIEAGDTYYVTANRHGGAMYAFYGADQAAIEVVTESSDGRFSVSNYEVVAPEGAAYIRLCSYFGTGAPTTPTIFKRLSDDKAVAAHNTATDAHNDIRLLVEGLTTRLNALANSDDTTLDQMAEVVAYIKSNRTLIESITTGKVSVSDIIDNLTTNVSNKPLSAAQGVALKALFDAIPSWAKQSAKPTYTASEVGADPSGTATSEVKKHNESTAAHEDIRELITQLSSEITDKTQLKAEFAESLEWLEANGDTSLLYVLPDGYIYSYSTVTETVAGYTNLADPTSDDWVSGARLNSSGGTTATEGVDTTNFIGPIYEGDVIRIQGMDMTTNNSYPVKTDKAATGMGIARLTTWANIADIATNVIATTTGGQLTVGSYSYMQGGYWRFSGALNNTAEDVIITVNEEITEETVTSYKWANTGHAFVPADYEDRINALEDDVLELQNTVESLGNVDTSGSVTIPAYWADMVNTKTETIKTLQEAGGKNCVSFAWASDTHIPDNDDGRTNDIGKVMAAMLDNCEIPFAVLTGDINTRASYAAEDGLVTCQDQMPIHLAPLWGTDRLLIALGNHDGCWGDSSGYYKKQFTPERMWQIFFRGQALDFRRVFSDDGMYYYVDSLSQKTRFIVLNSHFGGEYAEDENGWAVNNRFSTSCYGQAQLDWLADVALDMPESYGAIIFAHVPPNVAYTVDKEQLIGIVNAYCNKTTYSGSYTGVDGWTSNSVSVDFAGVKGEIIAMFTGHVHGDSIDTATMACPLLTILSAGAAANEAYADTAPTRTKGTDTETSFDVVTINKATKTICCTRVGAGSDREINY